MAGLPPLTLQVPGNGSPASASEPQKSEDVKQDSSTENQKPEIQEEKQERHYFYCSWPDFRVAKPNKPKIEFIGRFLETGDRELANWVLEITANSLFPCEVKQLTEDEYKEARFQEQVAASEQDAL